VSFLKKHCSTSGLEGGNKHLNEYFGRCSLTAKLADIVTLLHFTKANASAERKCPGGDGSPFKHTLDFTAIEKLNVLCASIYQRFMFPEMTMTSDFSSKSYLSR
jgi:hypothetical protein